MKTLLCLATAVLLAQAGLSEDLLATYQWRDVTNLPTGVTIKKVDGRDVLKIENSSDLPLQVNLLAIPNPKITAQVYELTGEVRYDDVQGDGYLELLNYFTDVKDGLPEGEYFSRTLDDSGSMGKISGTSGWRDFTLPFDRMGESGPPTRLRFNLVLKGRGTVYIGPVKLIQLPKAKGASSLVYPEAWWLPTTMNKIFGWGGGVVGCLGGLCGWLGAKGKARGFVVAVWAVLTGLGVVLGVGGLIALGIGQPVFVWGPLLFCAVLLASICSVNLRQSRRRYEEIELRRMASMDASGA